MNTLFIFIIGTFFGSFINALVYRLHHNLSFVLARSHCPKCQHTLTWHELIPVLSFLWQRGKCINCRQKISWQYPIVEILVGFLFVIIYQTHIIGPQFHLPNFPEIVYLVGLFVFTVWLVIIFVYDFKYYLILDKITLPAMVLALGWQMIMNFSFGHFLNILLAAMLGGGFFLLQFLVSKGKWIGGGDIRLGVLMGLLLGWPQVLVAMMLSYIIGAVVAIGMVLLKKKHWGEQIPFGTFLTIGTFIALLWGEIILKWYLGQL